MIVFLLAELRNKTPFRLGVGPSFQGGLPLPAVYFRVGGVTRDSTGAALGLCVVDLFLTATNVLMDSVVSDASGTYEFRTAGPSSSYYVVAYRAGSPDLAGTTVNTLVGT